MKALLSAATVILVAGTSMALAQDKPQPPAPDAPPPPPPPHAMHWKGDHHFGRRPMGTMIDVEKSDDGYRVRVVCSPETPAGDCVELTGKLLDRFPAAR